jgi:hypothetical protein
LRSTTARNDLELSDRTAIHGSRRLKIGTSMQTR